MQIRRNAFLSSSWPPAVQRRCFADPRVMSAASNWPSRSQVASPPSILSLTSTPKAAQKLSPLAIFLRCYRSGRERGIAKSQTLGLSMRICSCITVDSVVRGTLTAHYCNTSRKFTHGRPFITVRQVEEYGRGFWFGLTQKSTNTLGFTQVRAASCVTPYSCLSLYLI